MIRTTPGLTTTCGPSKCKKISALLFGICGIVVLLGSFAPLLISFVDFDQWCSYPSYSSCEGGDFAYHRMYLVIQMGLLLVMCVTNLFLVILSCVFLATPKKAPGYSGLFLPNNFFSSSSLPSCWWTAARHGVPGAHAAAAVPAVPADSANYLRTAAGAAWTAAPALADLPGAASELWERLAYSG